MLDLRVVVAAFWFLPFLNAKPAERKDDDAAEGGMEDDTNAML